MARTLHAPVGKTHAAIVADVPLASIALLCTAVSFEISGALMLCFGAPSLAVVHAFAAFIVLAIVAAAHQLLPVLFRAPPMPLAATLTTSAGFCGGFVLLILGFLGLPTFGWAVALLAPSAILWVAAIAYGLFAAQSERSTAVLSGIATAAFITAGSCAAVMAIAFARGGSFPIALASVHGNLMIVTFVSTFIIAMSYRFVPMFALSHEVAYGRRLWQYVVPAGGVAAAAGLSTRLAFGCVALALFIIGVQHVKTVLKRVRKKIDPSLKYAATGWCFGVAASVGIAIDGESARVVPAVLVLALLGWATLTIFGYGMKIVGFLSWQHARNYDDQRPLAPLSAAIPPVLNTVTLAVLSVGTFGYCLGLAVQPALLAPSAGLYLLGSAMYGGLIVRICLPYLKVSASS
jgi:hypothetical protein